MDLETLQKPDLNKPVFLVFPQAKQNIINNKCAMCAGEIVGFRDQLSRQEYSISGLCQKCQDNFFD